MNTKEQREKEEKKMESLKDPDVAHSREISYLIDKTLRDKHKVYCATDWHLWVRKEKNKKECHRRKDFEDIIKNVNETMTKDDLLIYLGDLVDGEFDGKEDLKSVLKTIPGKKVLVLGNNDILPTQFYKSCGFEWVVQSFVWSNVLFTHVPCRNDNQFNIHGHIHGYRTYWIPYTNQIDVGALGGRTELVELHDVITARDKYAKTIKEDPKHFNEGYECITEGDVFEKNMIHEIVDPFDD